MEVCVLCLVLGHRIEYVCTKTIMSMESPLPTKTAKTSVCVYVCVVCMCMCVLCACQLTAAESEREGAAGDILDS